MKGKIVKISSNLGFIEYGEGERVSYVYKDYKEFKIGDDIKFELILMPVVGTNQTFHRAINLKSIHNNIDNFVFCRCLVIAHIKIQFEINSQPMREGDKVL